MSPLFYLTAMAVVAGFFAVALLLSYQKNKATNQRLESLKGAMDTLVLPVAFADEHGVCFYANPAAKQALHITERKSLSDIKAQCQEAKFELLGAENGNMKIKSYICIDRSELDREIALHRKEVHWLTSILDALKSPLSVTNKDMEWTFINKVVEDMLGVKRADIVGKHCSNWGANICNTPNCGIACLKNGKHETFFSQFGCDFQVDVSYLYDENGEIDGHVEVVRDITELHSKSKEFETKAYWYESILDAIPFPVSVTDSQMKWTFINKAVEGFINKKRADVMGITCNNWGANICNTENCGIACAKRGITHTQFGQGDMVFQVDVAELKDLNGANAGHVEIVQDITKLDSTITQLKGLMVDINSASDQVTSGANMIADSNQKMAEGALTQASAIEELNASVDIVTEQIQTNAKNASNASDLSNKSKQNALSGNEEMKLMLSSMDGIKEASGNISKIIKTIEDIAFQTNLLALNAAVEAARAGEHGKGFAVVADEVRNLAGRSQLAAKETNELIIDTINRVEEGTKIAMSTAGSLNTIVSDFEGVSKIIDEIAAASSDQAEAIGQIGVGITQIAEVVQNNSATCQASASAAEELASQAETLKNLVVTFE